MGLCFLVIVVISCQNKTIENPKSIIPNYSFNMELRSDSIPNKIKYLEGTIYNNTLHDAHFGEYFKLQFYNDSSWEEVISDPQIAIHDIAYTLRPNGWSNFKYLLPHKQVYKSGKYRLLNDLTVTLEIPFYVSDSIQLRSDSGIIGFNNDNEIAIKMNNNIFPSDADSIIFSITNNTLMDIYPQENYFLLYYDDKNDNWINYYQSSHQWDQKRKLGVGESTNFQIVLNMKKMRSLHINQKKQLLHSGKYLIRKYVDIPVYAEFIFSSDSLTTLNYDKMTHEKPLRSYAEFEDGDSMINVFLKQYMKYPISGENLDQIIFAQGKLNVDTLGRVSNPRVIHVSDSVFLNESIKLLQDWKPARNTRGLQSSTKLVLIEFRDDNKKKRLE